MLQIFERLSYFRLHWIKKKEILILLRLNHYRVERDGPRKLTLEFRTVVWFIEGTSEK